MVSGLLLVALGCCFFLWAIAATIDIVRNALPFQLPKELSPAARCSMAWLWPLLLGVVCSDRSLHPYHTDQEEPAHSWCSTCCPALSATGSEVNLQSGRFVPPSALACVIDRNGCVPARRDDQIREHSACRLAVKAEPYRWRVAPLPLRSAPALTCPRLDGAGFTLSGMRSIRLSTMNSTGVQPNCPVANRIVTGHRLP